MSSGFGLVKVATTISSGVNERDALTQFFLPFTVWFIVKLCVYLKPFLFIFLNNLIQPQPFHRTRLWKIHYNLS